MTNFTLAQYSDFVRYLIEREMNRERERELLAMFNEAAAHVKEEDREERETLLGGFVGGSRRMRRSSG